jgi:hypothetical protein
LERKTGEARDELGAIPSIYFKRRVEDTIWQGSHTGEELREKRSMYVSFLSRFLLNR